MNRLLRKNLYCEIRNTLTRFLSIFAICALGVAFFAGIRATSPDMKEAAARYFKKYNLADITVLCSNGITEEDVRAIRKIEGVESVQPAVYADAMLTNGEDEYNVKLTSLPIQESEENSANPFTLPSLDLDTETENAVNGLELSEGRLPEDDHEVVLDAYIKDNLGANVGDYVTFAAMGSSVTLRVTGFFYSPQYLSLFERGSSTIGNGKCDAVAYASGNAVSKLNGKLPMLGLLTTRYTEAFITVSGAKELDPFSDEYEDAVSEVIHRIEEYGEQAGGTWYVQDRSSNPGYSDYCANTERIAAVGDVFPLIFFVVAALVSLTTMTRMVEDQRIEMGTLKALGYGKTTIMAKYVAYAVLASLSGSILGCLVGFQLFPYIICTAYNIMYRIPDFELPFRWDIAPVAVLAAVGCTLLATLNAAWSTLKSVPAVLMRPKAPKAGKRVFLERIGFLWKRLRFTSKVTVRNLLRYQKRFWMSVIGIAGSCALLVTGFGLRDSIFGIITEQFETLWSMDFQAYAYTTMEKSELEAILTSALGDLTLECAAYCYDKPLEAEKNGETVSNVHLFGTESPESLSHLVHFRDGNVTPVLNDDGVVITRKLSELFGIDAGDTITLVTGGEKIELPVTAVTDNYVYHYVYITPACYEKYFGKTMLYNGFLASIEGGMDDTEKQDALAESVLSDGRMYSITFSSGMYETVSNSLSTLNYVVVVLILGSALLTFVVMLNLTNINITERRRELATLCVLGFYDKEMYDYIFRENNALAVIGAFVGLALGMVMHAFVIKTCEVDLVMFVRQVKLVSFLYSFVLTLIFSLAVNLMMRKKVRSIDMVESLKSAE